MLHLKRPLVFLDLETTGTDVAKDRIVEIAFVKVFPDQTQETIPEFKDTKFLINPGMPIPIESSLVHGIYDADVKGAPLFSDCAPMLNDFIEGCDLAGYNSNKFDIPLLAEEFLRVGIPFTLDGRNTVDVQILFHKLEPRNLSAAFKYYTGGTLENAHAALIDTQATYEVFKGMYEKYKDDERALPTTIEEIEALSSYGKRADLIGNLQFNEEGDMVFGFGKHKGVKVADVLTREPGYFGWMMNADFPLYTKEVLRKFRNNMMV